MESVQTKEASPALNALTKHKARAGKPQNVVNNTTSIVENPKIEAAATPVTAPVNPPATPELKPDTQDTTDPRNSEVYRSLKAHHDKTTHELRQEVEQLRKDLTTANKPEVKLPKTKEEIEAYRKQAPDAIDVFTTIALEAANDTSKELKDKLDAIEKYHTELKQKEAFKALLDIHPDAMEIRSSQKFLEWYNEQPRAIQNILSESADISAVAKQLTLYKLEVLGINPKEKKKTEVQSSVDASLGVDIKGGRTEITAQKKIWTGSEINAICADYKTYLKYRVEIDEARREGRVDMSK